MAEVSKAKSEDGMQELDFIYMRRCFELAKQGLATASPNPMVGCVVVRDGVVLAEGFHAKRGEAHAERDALLKISDAVDATLYCNLEPCCHTKKTTPPCVPLIIEKKIKRVVISNVDPNPQVSGHGIELLRAAGIEVDVGVLADEGEALNAAFFTSMREARPLVTLKFAQTLDGKLATTSGDSKWISSEASRKRAHELRLSHDAVLIGRNTLNNDDPSLTIRFGIDARGKVPLRLVVGNPNKMNVNSKLFTDEYSQRTIIIATDIVPNELGHIKTIKMPATWKELWQELNQLEIRSVLVEGGPQILSSIAEEKTFDRVEVFIAPRLLGDGIALSGRAVSNMSQTINLSGEDVYVSAWRQPCSLV